MNREVLRAVAALLLVPLAVQLTGCVVHNPPRPIPTSQVKNPADEVIHGVTTTEGEVVMFDLPRVNPSRRDPGPGMTPRFDADTLYAIAAGESYRIPVDHIQRYWVRSISTGKTIGLNAAIVGGAILVVALIAANAESESQTTTQSCPFIYSWDGSAWVFDGEPYGGATTRGLEREDWAELDHLATVDGEYRLRVTNEVPEVQHTDLLELLVVDHAPGTRVVPDGAGGFRGVRAPVRPISATDETGADLLRWLSEEDRRVWEPAPEPGATEDRSEITLEFPKPRGVERATLVHRVGTGLWGSYMIKSMLQLHGSEVGTWYAALDSDPAARGALHAWNLREELYTLKVLVERDGGWEVGAEIDGGGPFIMESRAVPIEADPESDRLRIRIRPPRGFWALDAFAVEYGAAPTPSPVRLSAVRGEDHRGRDVVAAVSAADGAYYDMPTNDDRAELAFRAPPAAPGTERTVFLHARGWYRIRLDESRPPDRETLRRISEVPGAAVRYAAESFGAWAVASR